jgi:putative hydrolase of the HAD superfamily
MNLFEFDAVLFDLDNTIYDEKKYLYKAFEEIGAFCAANLNLQKQDVNSFLVNHFEKIGRSSMFNSLCEEFKLPEYIINKLLEILRTVHFNEKIQTFPYFLPLARNLFSSGVKLGIITNGNVIQQMNKVQSIDFKGLIEKFQIIYANDFSPKPSPISYEKMKQLINFKSCVYVGDSNIDKEFAKNACIPFLNVHLLRKEELGFV